VIYEQKSSPKSYPAASRAHVCPRSGLNCPLFPGGALYLSRHDSHTAGMHMAVLCTSRLKGIT